MKQSRNKLKVTAIVLVIVGAGMILASFFMPPIGEIHSSVIKAFGEIIGVVCFLGAWSVIEKAIEKWHGCERNTRQYHNIGDE